LATGKNTVFEAAPMPGLLTVMAAVRAVAMSPAGTAALSLDAERNAVFSGAPFQLMVAPETKPVPCTVSVNAAPPGATAVGASG
jgi:hypothetical protein